MTRLDYVLYSVMVLLTFVSGWALGVAIKIGSPAIPLNAGCFIFCLAACIYNVVQDFA